MRPTLVLPAFLTLSALASPAQAAPELRHSLGLDAAFGGWFGGTAATLDLRYGFDLLPALQIGAALGPRLGEEDLRGLLYVRGRLLRGGDADTFTGHALVATVGLGAFFTSDYPFVEPSLGWELRLAGGLGFGLDLGFIHSLVDESGWPFGRIRVAFSW